MTKICHSRNLLAGIQYSSSYRRRPVSMSFRIPIYRDEESYKTNIPIISSKQYPRLLPSIADTAPTSRVDIRGTPWVLFHGWNKARNLLNYTEKDIHGDNRPFPKKSFCPLPRTDDDAQSFPEYPACFRRASGRNPPSPRKPSNQQNSTCRNTGRKVVFPKFVPHAYIFCGFFRIDRGINPYNP